MNGIISNPGWDTLFMAIPFLIMMAVGMFRLDELIAAPKTRHSRGRKFCEIDENGRARLSDPDGRPSVAVIAGQQGILIVDAEDIQTPVSLPLDPERLLHVKETRGVTAVGRTTRSTPKILRKTA